MGHQRKLADSSTIYRQWKANVLHTRENEALWKEMTAETGIVNTALSKQGGISVTKGCSWDLTDLAGPSAVFWLRVRSHENRVSARTRKHLGFHVSPSELFQKGIYLKG